MERCDDGSWGSSKSMLSNSWPLSSVSVLVGMDDVDGVQESVLARIWIGEGLLLVV